MSKYYCANCRWYRKEYKACYRFPPTTIFNSQAYAYESVHPQIYFPQDDICGEFLDRSNVKHRES